MLTSEEGQQYFGHVDTNCDFSYFSNGSRQQEPLLVHSGGACLYLNFFSITVIRHHAQVL